MVTRRITYYNLKDEQFDLGQLMKNEDDNFELNDGIERLHEKSIARMVMSMWNS